MTLLSTLPLSLLLLIARLLPSAHSHSLISSILYSSIAFSSSLTLLLLLPSLSISHSLVISIFYSRFFFFLLSLSLFPFLPLSFTPYFYSLLFLSLFLCLQVTLLQEKEALSKALEALRKQVADRTIVEDQVKRHGHF